MNESAYSAYQRWLNEMAKSQRLTVDKLCQVVKNTSSTTNLATLSRIEANSAGSTTDSVTSITFLNVGTTAAIVLDSPLNPGESVKFEAFFNPEINVYYKIPSIGYVASATAVLHITTVS